MVAKTNVLVAFLATLLFASMATAQPLHLQPGSALIYPLFDSTPGAGTLICVTNTNTVNRYCPDSDYREGDVLVHFQYVDGDDCLEFDRYEFLSPGDTLCVIADLHNPEGGHGYVVLSAADPSDGEKILFDYLIGSAIVVQSDLNFLWAYTPYAFQALPTQGGAIAPCNRPTTDTPVGDGDGAMDFDNVEYSWFPRELFIDSFFEERNNFGNQLTLMSTAGQDYINEVGFWFWNNVETRFSRTLKFVCWWSGPLSEISRVVGDLGGDEEELGHPPVETGWVHIRGNRILDLAGNPVEAGDGIPPILGVFAQYVTESDFAAGRALQYRGTIDGLEILNGNGM
jgi:hypothetical protein